MLHPVVAPNSREWLDVGDGQRIYVETSGNPTGPAALVLHGGPGSGQVAWLRRHLDPAHYRIVALHQRQCGRSTPHASEPMADPAVNTTWHLVADLERVRDHLGVTDWLLLGLSWGSTLALAYAETHAERVRSVVLAAITTTRPAEVRWLTHGVGAFLPEQWERFRNAVPAEGRDETAMAYRRLVHDPDPSVHEPASRAWCAWEDALAHPDDGHDPRYDDPRFRLSFARIVTHYFAHAAWLEPGQLIRDAGRLRDIPAVLVHGRLDLGSPPRTVWELSHAWPGARLQLVAGGHAGQAAMSDAVRAAADSFR